MNERSNSIKIKIRQSLVGLVDGTIYAGKRLRSHMRDSGQNPKTDLAKSLDRFLNNAFTSNETRSSQTNESHPKREERTWRPPSSIVPSLFYSAFRTMERFESMRAAYRERRHSDMETESETATESAFNKKPEQKASPQDDNSVVIDAHIHKKASQ